MTLTRGSDLSCASPCSTATLVTDLPIRASSSGPNNGPATGCGTALVEAFSVEKRLPDKRVGPAMVRNTWRLDTVDTFAEVVDQGEQARAHVWEQWARAGGALPYEISRMEEALSWPGLVLSNGHAVEGRILLAWGFCVAYGRPVRALLRKRGWSRTTFYRSVETGADRIASYLNARAVAVR